MLSKWGEIKEVISDWFKDLKEWAYDVFIGIFQAILGGIAKVVEMLPMPEFMLNYSVTDYLHNDILYFLAMSNFGSALAMIGSAYVFRIARRFVTLGIW